MLADAHRQAALDLERSVAALGDPAVNPWNARAIIALCWDAAFHWVAYGCQVKHGKHKENHTKLVQYLNDLGEPTIGRSWEALENARRGGMYGHHATPPDVSNAQRHWQDIRTWATT